MNRLWLIYTAFLAAVLIADIGFAAAKVIWPHPTNRDSSTVFDADYVQGLAKLGIVKLPGYQPSPAVPITTK